MVEARVVGQAASGAASQLDFGSRAMPATLRALLREVVANELVSYSQESRRNSVLRTLTPPEPTGGDPSRFLTQPLQIGPNLGLALARVVEAFEDGLYYVFADGYQVDELDAPLPLRNDSTLRFVRLVAQLR